MLQPPIGSTMRTLSILALIVVAPALAQSPAPTETAPLVAPFSSGKAGAAFPSGWIPIKINDQKKPTLYDLVDDQGRSSCTQSPTAPRACSAFTRHSICKPRQ